MRAFVLLMLCACGRLGYDEHPPLDAVVDAAPTCPEATVAIVTGGSVCVETTERGNLTWTTAKADCESLGRRLCADAEWFTACTNHPTLVDMTDGDFEWVAEMMNGVAQKRGPLSCDGTSAHEIFVDPYPYRCCVDL